MYFRVLFWTEIGPLPGIGRAYMDGTSREYIVSRDILVPNGLAIDYEGYIPSLLHNSCYTSSRDNFNNWLQILNKQNIFYIYWFHQRIDSTGLTGKRIRLNLQTLMEAIDRCWPLTPAPWWWTLWSMGSSCSTPRGIVSMCRQVIFCL